MEDRIIKGMMNDFLDGFGIKEKDEATAFDS